MYISPGLPSFFEEPLRSDARTLSGTPKSVGFRSMTRPQWLILALAAMAGMASGMGDDCFSLTVAAKYGHSHDVEDLLSEGVDVDCLGDGWTPLQFAVSEDHADTV